MFYFKIFKAWNPPLFFTQNLMQKCNKKKKIVQQTELSTK